MLFTYIAIRGDVAFRPGQASHQAKMAKNNLDNFGRISRKDSEWIVPETTGNNESTVHSHDEAIGSHFDFLAKIIS